MSRTPSSSARPARPAARAVLAACPVLVAMLAALASAVAGTPRAADAAEDEPPPWSDTPRSRPLAPPSTTHAGGPLDAAALQSLVDSGEALFTRRFSVAEGGTRPMATQAILPTKRRRAPRSDYARTSGLDANACSGCHNVPVIGGAGDFSANVFVSEGFRQADFDSTDPQFSNERNTNHLFGAGLVELLAREMSRELQRARRDALDAARLDGEAVRASLSAKGVDFGTLLAHPDGRVDTRGLDGVDADLVIRPFGTKGVMTSLRQFTVNALNHHHGIQAEERFGARWTDEADFDQDGLAHEIGAHGVSALVAWQATLPPPGRRVPVRDAAGRALNTATRAAWTRAAGRGEAAFGALGCSDCHRPALPLDSLVFHDPGDFDAAGTLRRGEVPGMQYDLALRDWAAALPRDAHGRVLVPLFGDLKRHAIADRQLDRLGNELLSQRFVERNVFQTAELWGVGSSAPYGHRGDIGTLGEVIEAHGGQARPARQAWLAAPSGLREDVLAFLKTLRLPE